MFRKMKLKKKIRESRMKIEEMERKRSRSQAAIVSAIVSQTEPNDADVDFFNLYTQKIDSERKIIRDLMNELDAL